MAVEMLSSDEVRAIHADIVAEYDETPSGVRDTRALNRIDQLPDFASTDTADILETVVRTLVVDHPFVDGNKRTAVNCAAVLAARAGYTLTITRNLGMILKTLGIDQRVIDAEGFATHLDQWLTVREAPAKSATTLAQEHRDEYRDVYDWLESN